MVFTPKSNLGAPRQQRCIETNLGWAHPGLRFENCGPLFHETVYRMRRGAKGSVLLERHPKLERLLRRRSRLRY